MFTTCTFGVVVTVVGRPWPIACDTRIDRDSTATVCARHREVVTLIRTHTVEEYETKRANAGYHASTDATIHARCAYLPCGLVLTWVGGSTWKDLRGNVRRILANDVVHEHSPIREGPTPS